MIKKLITPGEGWESPETGDEVTGESHVWHPSQGRLIQGHRGTGAQGHPHRTARSTGRIGGHRSWSRSEGRRPGRRFSHLHLQLTDTATGGGITPLRVPCDGF